MLSIWRVLLGLTLSALCLSHSSAYADEEIGKLKAQIKALKAELTRRPKDPSSYPIPTQISFCGDLIDLTKVDIKRRFESEIIKIIKNRHQVQLYINRATAAFPVIDEIAKELDTCADLKFLAVVESALKPKVVSRAKAAGWWQFMPVTAKGFKLKVTKNLDERSDLRASTKAALTYLKRLYKRFDSWPLAMAGYNTGPNRLKRLSKKQKRGKFWELDLYTEAERYSPRVLAMYHVLTHLKAYDFGRDLNEGWPQEPLIGYRLTLPTSKYRSVKYITVTSKSKKRRGKNKKRRTRKKKVVTISAQVKYTPVSLALDLPLRDLQRFNPHLRGKHLPLGLSFDLYLPPGRTEFLKKTFKGQTVKIVYRNRAARQLEQKKHQPTPPVERPSPTPKVPLQTQNTLKAAIDHIGGKITDHHIVESGDQLWQIAARAQLSLNQLKRLNGLGPLSTLKVGQRLKLTLE